MYNWSLKPLKVKELLSFFPLQKKEKMFIVGFNFKYMTNEILRNKKLVEIEKIIRSQCKRKNSNSQ